MQRLERGLTVLLRTTHALSQLGEYAWVNAAANLLRGGVALLELPPEQLQLLLVFAQKRRLIQVLVDDGGVLDVLGTVGKDKRGEGLRVRLQCGGDAGDQRRLAVAAEGVPQGACQDGVSKRHVPMTTTAFARESRDDVAELMQGFVDLLRLLQSLARDTRLPQLLAAGQVDNVQLAKAVRGGVRLIPLHHLHDDGEHGVGA
ncbi:uncharacterized protein Tco025E_00117 [Trypanosoma conorhini]|uniref:Uncharacterized protein n=1 Tax=Trypanosoma conorhini TaxID=83891 RepID=A0A3R7P278_9TRYP|nr:uncharacterized protein Tco025E_00117 [Trypanosoma conorhini]RNF27733.1 hypothetical protein Tco025E_00117 [Trypanosoma conorhini]